MNTPRPPRPSDRFETANPPNSSPWATLVALIFSLSLFQLNGSQVTLQGNNSIDQEKLPLKTTSISLPPFSATNSGTLERVEIKFDAIYGVRLGIDNLKKVVTTRYRLVENVYLQLTFLDQIASGQERQMIDQDSLGALAVDDGTDDFSGPDGVLLTNSIVIPVSQLVFTNTADLKHFQTTTPIQVNADVSDDTLISLPRGITGNYAIEYGPIVSLSATVTYFFTDPSGPPRIEAKSDGNQLTLSWPESPSSYQLESSEGLPQGAIEWKPSTEAVKSINGRLVVTVELNRSSTFFRLRRI